MLVIGIDPGSTESGYCILSKGRIMKSGKVPCKALMPVLMSYSFDRVYIERIVLYRRCGSEVRDACEWSGRYDAWACAHGNGPVTLITRSKVRGHLGCNDDREVRAEMIRRGYGGLVADAWQALAVALVGMEMEEE